MMPCILNIDIDNINYKKSIEKIKTFLNDGKQHYIATINPEIILKAQKDAEYRMILNNADIKTPDGFGIILGSIFLNQNIYTRVTGVDLTYKISKFASENGYKIFLLGGRGDCAQIAKTKLETKYKNIKIVGATSGFSDIYKISENENQQIIESIKNSDAQILFVGYGAPFQEKWIYKNLKNMPNIRLAIGVGGTIDFISGKAKRAPKFIRKIGLEWFWRLIREPYRAKRIINATIVYIYNLIKWKIHLHKPFRNNVVAVIINTENKILIIKELYEKTGYRLPQGGVEKNEDIEIALKREIQEETGFTKIQILGMATRTNSHYWPMTWHNIPSYQKKYNEKFCGQKQSIYFVRQTENEKFNPEEKEIIDHKWVNKEELYQYISPIKKNILQITLNEINKYLK